MEVYTDEQVRNAHRWEKYVTIKFIKQKAIQQPWH